MHERVVQRAPAAAPGSSRRPATAVLAALLFALPAACGRGEAPAAGGQAANALHDASAATPDEAEDGGCDGTEAATNPPGGIGSMAQYTKPSDDELKQKLSPLQYQVTQQEGTEAPFRNAYWDNHEDGLYVDVVTGEPLFSSADKYDSGTGWPSFTKPLEPGNVTTKVDHRLGVPRTEVRSSHGDSHLGHVFPDGPRPTGQRYCMNSAALRFVPVDRLEAEGYGKYLSLFGRTPKGGDAAAAPASAGGAAPAAAAPASGVAPTGASSAPVSTARHEYAEAILAGGCFWGMEDLLRKLPGVIDTEVGYTGGLNANPTYERHPGHAEAVRIRFDPARLPYEDILRYFFRLHDPTTLNRQGNDVGSSYRSAIFWRDEQQREAAEKVKAEVDRSGKWKAPVVTEVTQASAFWPAEDYHQDYLQKNPGGYTCHWLRD